MSIPSGSLISSNSQLNVAPDISTPSMPQSNLSGELAHVTEEMYKKNFELAETNKTLSLLRKIDEIILSSVTDINQIAQQVANNIVVETDFRLVTIYLLNRQKSTLELMAISQMDPILQAQLMNSKPLAEDSISLLEQANVVAQGVNAKMTKITHLLYDVLVPAISAEDAQRMQAVLGVKALLVHPLLVRGEIIGAMVIGTTELETDLSSLQRDLIERLVGVIGIAIDNSLLYQKIEEANQRLQQVDKLKDEFVSIASHELRTPMTAIKSYLWMYLEDAKKGIHGETDTHYLERAYSAADRLIRLVNDMLNVSRIEGGRLIINKKSIDLLEIVQNVVADLLPVAQREKITLSVNEPTIKMPYVDADADKIREVLTNLIGNALKFTQNDGTGKITLTFELQQNIIVISISDNGKGMSQEDIAKLFQKFAQVGDQATNKPNTEGTGLGLYISKSIIELHGGKMWVASELGKGTTFYFTLLVSTLYKSLAA